jgi:outer membrane protein OmpA-like peptidoglycan-associated protein
LNEEVVMTRQLAFLILGGFTILGSACATKNFVEKQMKATEAKLTQQTTATETRLTERVDLQETKLRETADREGAGRQAIDAASQQLKGLDTRVDEMGVLATDAKTRAEAAQDANARLSQRLARRNSYRLLETRFLYFERDQAEIRNQDITELEEVAKVLMADVNAVLELQGFADPRGSDRYNYQLARERVDAVTRHLVQHHGIELRQLRAVSMGKVALAAGEKPSTEALGKARRVDIRLLTPWSSWEDAGQTQMGEAAPAQAATVALPAPRESEQPTPAATVVPPIQPVPTQRIQVSRADAGPAVAASPMSVEPDQPATPKKIPPRSGPGDEFKNGAPGRALLEFLKNLSPADLGGKY